MIGGMRLNDVTDAVLQDRNAELVAEIERLRTVNAVQAGDLNVAELRRAAAERMYESQREHQRTIVDEYRDELRVARATVDNYEVDLDRLVHQIDIRDREIALLRLWVTDIVREHQRLGLVAAPTDAFNE